MTNTIPPDMALSPEERASLEGVARSGDVTLARRARIILAWDDGLSTDQIAEQVGLSMRTVDRWLRAFHKTRLEIFPTEVSANTPSVTELDEGPAKPAEPGMIPITVAELCRRYQVDMGHAHHVGYLAVELFNLTQTLHRLDDRWRELIFTAGILHNVAFAGGVAKHHTRGRDIILENPLSDLSDLGRIVVAMTTSFHRKAWRPDRVEKEPAYAQLTPEIQEATLKLAALVRLADGLDYSQSQTTILGPCQAGPAGVHITVVGPFAESDAARAEEKADMWLAVVGVPIRITASRDLVAFEADEAQLRASPQTQAAPLPLLPNPGVQSDDLMSEAGRKVLRFHFERMLFYEPGTRLGEDVEALHDMRVATRRMRAAFRVFEDAFEPKLKRHLLRELRRTAQTLGAVRDLDVFMQNAQLYLASLPAGRQSGLEPLFEAWQGQREKARTRLLDYLDSEAYRAFVDDFSEFVSTPGLGSIDGVTDRPSAVLVWQVVPRLIYTRYEAVRAYENVIENASLQTLHALRIDGKRLRYTLEFFSEVLGGEAKDVIALTVKLQDHLGALHDADVACEVLRNTMEKLLKKARKQQEQTLNTVSLPDLSGIAAYLNNREMELTRLRQTFPDIWATLISPETRRKLALAVSVL